MTWRQAVDIALSRGLWKGMRSIVAQRLLNRAYLALGQALFVILDKCGMGQREPIEWTFGWTPAPGSITTARFADDAISGEMLEDKPLDNPGQSVV